MTVLSVEAIYYSLTSYMCILLFAKLMFQIDDPLLAFKIFRCAERRVRLDEHIERSFFEIVIVKYPVIHDAIGIVRIWIIVLSIKILNRSK